MRSLTYLHKKVLLGLASDTPRRERERKVSNKPFNRKGGQRQGQGTRTKRKRAIRLDG